MAIPDLRERRPGPFRPQRPQGWGAGGQGGRATVAENLQEVVGALLDSLPPAVVGLAMTRPAAASHTREGLQSGVPAFDALQQHVTAYLQAEQHAGRIPAGSDAATIALALVGTTHHLLMTGDPAQPTDTATTAQRLLAVLLPC